MGHPVQLAVALAVKARKEPAVVVCPGVQLPAGAELVTLRCVVATVGVLVLRLCCPLLLLSGLQSNAAHSHGGPPTSGGGGSDLVSRRFQKYVVVVVVVEVA